MNESVLNQQNILLQNRERIFLEMKKYPNVVHVGVGVKESNHQFTNILCYRIYVSQKKSPDALQEHERIPASIEGFATDVLLYGEIAQALDNGTYRPLKGGIQIKNDLYVDVNDRGGGTLGCLAYLDDGSDTIVGLTNQHVVAWNTSDEHPEIAKHEIGQPYKRISWWVFTKNIIGTVLKAIKTDRLDCAIIKLNANIINDIKLNSTVNEIHGIGFITGKAIAVAGANTPVRKSGAGTGVKSGIVTEVAFENGQLLISPENFGDVFVDFGDSGSVFVDDQNRVMGLIWGIKRDRIRNLHEPTVLVLPGNPYPQRTHAVATPIDAVETALGIKIPIPPPVVPTITIHTDDKKTHLIPSSLPATQKPKKHFVTVRGSGNIILNVTFDQPVNATRVKWVSDNPDLPVNFPGPGGDNFTATISRDIFKGSKAMIGVTVDGYGVGEKLFVWVVWAAPLAADMIKLPFELSILPTLTFVTQTFMIKYSIQPAEMINEQMDQHDLPDLRGANTTPVPNVDDTDTGVFAKGDDLSGGAINKWDGSVRLKCKGSHPGIFLNGGFDDIHPNYPSSELVGNFDTNASVIEGNPYSNADLGGLGKIYGDTTIGYSVARNLGSFHDIMGTKIHIQQFARLELDGHWYVISSSFPWRLDIKLIKESEFDKDTDYDGDGIKQGDDWISHLITVDSNNDDF